MALPLPDPNDPNYDYSYERYLRDRLGGEGKGSGDIENAVARFRYERSFKDDPYGDVKLRFGDEGPGENQTRLALKRRLMEAEKLGPSALQDFVLGNAVELNSWGLGNLAQSTLQQVKSKGLRSRAEQLQFAAPGEYERQEGILANRARVKALEEDPEFQGTRAQLVSGSARALGSLQNRQGALGISGGTALGSQQEISDRLSLGLAQLGQEQEGRRQQAETQLFQFRKAKSDFDNSKVQLLGAIESGDFDLAQNLFARTEQRMNQVEDFNRQIAENEKAYKRQLIGGLIGSAISASAGVAAASAGAPTYNLGSFSPQSSGAKYQTSED